VRDPSTKAQIRSVVETEERRNYEQRMSQAWKDELQPMVGALHTDGVITKPYLTEAPYLVAVFAQIHGGMDAETGRKVEHYYVQQSVGISVGLFVTALQFAGLCSLVSTTMGAETELARLLDRPSNEKLFALMPVGSPAKDATVPYRDPLRKPLMDIMKVV